MRKKLLFLTGIALLLIAVANLLVTPVSAQCGTDPNSSCVECHRSQAPVSGDYPQVIS